MMQLQPMNRYRANRLTAPTDRPHNGYEFVFSTDLADWIYCKATSTNKIKQRRNAYLRLRDKPNDFEQHVKNVSEFKRKQG